MVSSSLRSFSTALATLALVIVIPFVLYGSYRALQAPETQAEGNGWQITRGLLDSPESVATMESFLGSLSADCKVDAEVVELANQIVFVYACP